MPSAVRRTRLLVAAALTAACIALPAAPASANPCHEDPCPPCHTAWIDALWQKYTGLGPLFMCPT